MRNSSLGLAVHALGDHREPELRAKRQDGLDDGGIVPIAEKIAPVETRSGGSPPSSQARCWAGGRAQHPIARGPRDIAASAYRMIVFASEPSDETHVSLAASLRDIEAGAVVGILGYAEVSRWRANR